MTTAGDLFPVIAESSATLIGLLFVALSLAPHREASSHLAVVQQVRSAAALHAFSSALAVSLFGLVAGNNVGYPATVVGVIGIFFTAAGVRSMSDSTKERRVLRKQLGLVVLLLVTFGCELGAGITLLVNRHSSTGLEVLGDVLVASLLIGVARSWELVGERDTGIISSIAVLSRHTASPPQAGDDVGGKPLDRPR